MSKNTTSSRNASGIDKSGFVNAYPISDVKDTEEIIVQAHPVPQSSQVSLSRPRRPQSIRSSASHARSSASHTRTSCGARDPSGIVPNYNDDLDDYSLDLLEEQSQKNVQEQRRDVEADEREEASDQQPATTPSSSSSDEQPGQSSASSSHQKGDKKKLFIVSGLVLVAVIVGVVVGVVVGGGKGDEDKEGGGPTVSSTANPYPLSTECTEEISSLNSRASILEALSQAVSYEESVQCPANDDCYYDYAAYEDVYESACRQEGGFFLTLDYSVGCEGFPNRNYYANSPRCIGVSCDPGTYTLNTLHTMKTNLEQDNQGSSCDARLEFGGIPTTAEETTVAPSGELTQQCVDEYDEVSNHASIADAVAARSDVEDAQFDSCRAGSSKVCPIDYASLGSLYESACGEAGGKFISFDYTVTCEAGGVERSNFPLCIGASCDTGAFQTSFLELQEQLLQEKEATKSCVIEG